MTMIPMRIMFLSEREITKMLQLPVREITKVVLIPVQFIRPEMVESKYSVDVVLNVVSVKSLPCPETTKSASSLPK